MATPDFSKKVIETLAKRAAYMCSNPDCKKVTVGPNSDAEKSTLIGEAAHIYGARPKSKRYIAEMNDIARAEITNAIWLCRNCHKLIDTDEIRYSSNVLFSWRECHEKFILSELGNETDKLQHKEQEFQIKQFKDYPPIISRIVLDKPTGWEYRLSAELMRFLYKPYYRKLSDLKEGLYVKTSIFVDEDDVIEYIRRILSEQSRRLLPIEKLFGRLTKSWGELGEPGNLDDIHHVICLIRDNLRQVVELEEQIMFTNVPEKYENILELLKGNLGSQFEKIKEIPDELDSILLMAIEHKGEGKPPLNITKTVTFDYPPGWSKKMNKEIKKLNMSNQIQQLNESGMSGCLIFIVLIFLVWLISVFV